jgi:hypothetical protein
VVRFRPEERQGLMESLGPDLGHYSGLGLARVEEGWHTCLLRPDEVTGLSQRLAAMLVAPAANPPLDLLARAADRVMAAQTALSHTGGQRPRQAGLTLAAVSLCREGEHFPIPAELAQEVDFLGNFNHRQDDDADIKTKLFLLLMPHADNPLPELGGLTAKAFARLVSDDWLDDQAKFHLRNELPSALLDSAPALSRARLLLETVAQREPLPADSLDRLPMGVVLSLVASPEWRESGEPGGWEGAVYPSEDKVRSVSITRAMLECAGLLRCSLGQFRLSDLGRKMLKPKMRGELYVRLFEARLRQGAGFDHGDSPICHRFHRAMAYHLYRLATCLHSKQSFQSLIEWVALPAWLYGLNPATGAAELYGLMDQRLLAPLNELGLIKAEPTSSRHASGNAVVYEASSLLEPLMAYSL